MISSLLLYLSDTGSAVAAIEFGVSAAARSGPVFGA